MSGELLAILMVFRLGNARGPGTIFRSVWAREPVEVVVAMQEDVSGIDGGGCPCLV